MTSFRLPPDLADGDEFRQRLEQIYGDAAVRVLQAMSAPRESVSFWLNPLLGKPAVMPEAVEALPSLPGLYTHRARESVTRSEAASLGQIYIQNPSSHFAVRVLAPAPGEEILDLAAAPGGKTVAMSVAMQNTGRIAAVEPVPGRFHRLRANLQRCGVTNVEFYKRDGRGVGRVVPARFDRVLLDAPCSSEARMRWSAPASYQHWSLRKVKETSRKQKSLIRSAYAALKPGGRLVYCTCSLSPEENELVVSQLLRRSDAEIVPVEPPGVPVMGGLTQWQNKALAPALAATLRILPGPVWDGFYLACIRKPV